MRRMLNPKEVLPSTIEFDKDGNRTVGKNLTVNRTFLLIRLRIARILTETQTIGTLNSMSQFTFHTLMLIQAHTHGIG